MDPALWAELEGRREEVVAALMRLVPGAPVPARVRVVERFGEIATIRVRRGDLPALRADPAVASLEAPRAMAPEGQEPSRPRGRALRSLGKGQPSGRGTVIGVVDWGCDVTHPNLQTRDGRTRLLALWDQRARGSARAPAPYGYGVVHTRRAIDRALAGDDVFGALDYDPADVDDDGRGTHGTHVIDIAAGAPRAGPGGVAPHADLVFVHLAALSRGPRHIASSVCLLEAIGFIARAAGARPWVTNLSLGSHAGPHDGTTLVEQALDEIVTRGPGRVIVQSCGNDGRRPVRTSGDDRAFVATTTTGTICNGRHTISVGAYDPRTRSRAAFSSVGPTRDGRAKPDVLAHGVGVLAARSAPPRGSDDERDDLLTVKSGTSMASPHVAGAVAVLYEAAGRPLAAAEVKQILVDSGRRVDGGPPVVDLRAAVARVRRGAGPQLPDATTAAAQFDAFFANGGEALPGLHVIGRPGEPTVLPIRDGDILVRRALGEGRLARIGRAAELNSSERIPYDAVVLREAGSGEAPRGPCDPDSQTCSPAPADAAPPQPTRTVEEWLALDVAPAADDATVARGIEVARATAENRRWWTALQLDRVKPLRGLDPVAFPKAYANRTLRLQSFLRAQAIDIKILERKIVADGILGPDTLMLAHQVSRLGELAFLRTDLTVLGVAMERLLAIGAEAGRKARISALPLEVTYAWDVTSSADKVVALYEQRHADAEERRLELQRVLLSGFSPQTWPAFVWPTYLDLARRLYGTRPVRGRAVLLRGRRRAEREDVQTIAGRDLLGKPYLWFRDPTERQREQLGAADPTAPAGRRALEAWARSDGDPNVDLVMSFDLPEVTDETRKATVLEWMTDLEVAESRRKQHNRESLQALAAHFTRRLEESRDFVWEQSFARDVSDLVRYPPDVRGGFLDEIARLARLPAFYDAFADMVNHGQRSVAADLTKRTKYETDTSYLKYLATHHKKTEQVRRHTYDVKRQQILLDKKGDRVLRVGSPWPGVAGDVYPVYKREAKFERVKPARQRELCRQTLKELVQLIAEAAATAKGGGEGKSTTPNELLETAVNRAREAMRPPLGKDDVETVAWEMSVRVTALRSRPEGGVERVEIEYEIVERIDGGPWIAVPCSRRWRSEQELSEELSFIFLDRLVRVVTWIAAFVVGVVAIGLLATSVVGAALLRLAGGARFLLANVVLAEAIYVLTSGGEVTWEGFVQAALGGYLQAVGFRLFAPVGNRIGALVAGRATGLSFTRAAATWLVTKGVTGGGAVALQGTGMLLTMDLVNVMRGGRMSSWRDYLSAAGHGAVLGAVLEIGLGTAITGLGGALRGTVAHKLARALASALRETKQVLQGMTPGAFLELCARARLGFDDFLFGAAQGLSRFKVWLREVIQDPKLAAAAAEGVTKQLETSAKAFADKVAATPGAAKAAGKRALDNIAVGFHADILALSEIALGDDAIRGLRRMLSEHGRALRASDLTTAMQQLRAVPKVADGLLAFLGALDQEVLARVLQRDALFELIGSKGLASLVARGSEVTVGDLRTLFQQGFKGRIPELDTWVADVDKLAADAQLSIFGAMRTHIDVLSPSGALGLVRQNVLLDLVHLEGIAVMVRASSREAMDGLIAKALRVWETS
ncbi:MAG: S8 family serine peptidase [Deltaproteobacteria bacterium]|nr:S8 family serine peptidase [Deltaproteobacteria bacterium]